jgi:hypothetical protein
MSLELMCATIIALLLGAIICFGGYRFFLILLPIWGFFFGFGLGAQAVQTLFGDAFLATVTSWAVGFVVAIIFGLLSYLFYIGAVAIVAASLGYGLVVAILGAINFPFGIITWISAAAVAIIFAFVTVRWNLAKYVIIIATALGGAGLAIGTLLLGVEGVSVAQASTDPIRTMLQGSPLWSIIFVLMAAAGVIVQLRAGRNYQIQAYENRI